MALADVWSQRRIHGHAAARLQSTRRRATVHVANGLKQQGAIAEWLEHVALGTGGHRLLEEVDAFLRRDHDHGAMRSAAGDQPGRLNAIQVGHVDVHQDDVRLELGGASNRLVTARGGADQVHIGLSLDEHRQRLADGDAVVNREHSDWVRLQIRQEDSRGINRRVSKYPRGC